MKRLFLGCLATLIWFALCLPPVSASKNVVHVLPAEGGLVASVTGSSPGTHSSGSSGETTSGSSAPAPGSSIVSQDVANASALSLQSEIGTELFDLFCGGANWSTICDPSIAAPPVGLPVAAPAAVAAAAAPVLTPGMVAEAFRSIDLPASELVVQPPDGRTLVNFATNFYTEQGSFTREVRLLGQRVELRIWPSRFGWRFGDGRSLATRQPGAPYPHLQVTHEYAADGGVHPSVDTTYAAQFRVNGGPWRDVDGTVTVPGAPVDLEVLTATPELVGYR